MLIRYANLYYWGYIVSLMWIPARFISPNQRSVIEFQSFNRWSRVLRAASRFIHWAPTELWHRVVKTGLNRTSHNVPEVCVCFAVTRVHPSIPFFYPSLHESLWLTWQQTMSRPLFWWHHCRRHANPPKTVMSLLHLSVSVSLSLSDLLIWNMDHWGSLSRGWRQWKRRSGD